MGRLAAVLLLATGGALAAGVGGALGLVPPTVTGGVALAALGVLAVAVVAGSIWPRLGVYGRPVLRGSGARVALTFDDGPDPASTPALLEALDRAGARATFFVLADRVEAHPELARAIAARHEVALHGRAHHPWLTVRAPRRGEAELREAAAIVAQATGTRPTRFRPPFGVTSPRVFDAARRAGLEVVWCSLRTGDGGRMSASELRRRCQAATGGDIVLLHEGPRAAREALPGILADLEARGLAAVTVSEILR